MTIQEILSQTQKRVPYYSFSIPRAEEFISYRKRTKPNNNEIWYWGDYYDLENTINILSQDAEVHYRGPAILSNELVGNKYVITFDGPVTKLGAVETSEETVEFYPLFVNEPEFSLTCNITKIEIPNSVTNIGSSAFQNCTGLTSVTIPNSVTSIGNSAFYNCSGLTSVTIGNRVTSIGGGAFRDCIGLTSVTIGISVTSIGRSAFSDCDSLTSIIIPNSVTSIGSNAFYDCSSLNSVTIGNSVTSIGNLAFSYCHSLTSISYTGTMSDWNKIELGDDWNQQIQTGVVHCIDGDVAI